MRSFQPRSRSRSCWTVGRANRDRIAPIGLFGDGASRRGANTNTSDAIVTSISPSALTALGHKLKVEPPRTAIFGRGQAILSRPDGVHLGASEPRHDGSAVPEAPPVFKDVNR